MITLAGIAIHDPDVVFTDLALALLGGLFRVATVDQGPGDRWSGPARC